MKLSAYIVKYDCGFAPNPFGGFCTLACCKPTIRRMAEKDDIIVGTASSRLPHPGWLIYAMRVAEVLSFNQYWSDSRFADRKPSPASPIRRRGDNIWHHEREQWQGVPGAIHDESNRDKDVSGENVLIAMEFFYFGSKAIPVDGEFRRMLATTQGHKNTHDRVLIDRFWNWLHDTHPKGRIADPSEFDDAGCRSQCIESDDDVEEGGEQSQALSLDSPRRC